MSLNRPHEHWQVLCFWLLVALTAGCFWPAITGPFVFDDFPNLQNLAQLDGRIDRSSVGLYLATFPGNPGRPLAALSFLIEDWAWPTSAEAFKRNNVLFHLLAGCLILLLARMLARQRHDPTRATLAALVVTGMWWLHPMQLSATMLVVQRMTILSAIFVLAGLLLYLKALSLPRLTDFLRVALAGALLGLCAVLAFLCKENGVLAFAYASALNLTLIRPRLQKMTRFNRNLLVWGTASPILMLCAITLAYLPGIADSYQTRDFTLGERLLTQPRILLEYLFTIALPRSGGQGVFHDDYVVSRSLLDPLTTGPALLAILALLASAVWLRKRAPLYAFAVLWFFAGHLLESTVVPLELYFEHRNYLPMFGPFYATACVVFGSSRRFTMAALIVLSVWLLTAALSTRVNAGIWGDAGRLATLWAQQSPRSVRAAQMLASHYADRGEIDQAKKTFDVAIQMMPQERSLYLQRTLLDCVESGMTETERQELLRIAGQPKHDRGIVTIAASFSERSLSDGCHGTWTPQNARSLISALLTNPAYADDESKGFLYYELSRLDLAEHNLDALMQHMDLSNRYRPNPLVEREQAIYLLTAGLPQHALRYLDRSEQAPIPSFKRWLLQMPARNQSLRNSASRMQTIQPKNPPSPDGF